MLDPNSEYARHHKPSTTEISTIMELEPTALKGAIERINEITEEMDNLKQEKKMLEEVLIAATISHFESELKRKGKTHGAVTVKLDDGIELTLERKQTVTWDQEKLQNVYECLPIETASKIIELKMSVPERVYAAISDPDLLNDLKAARTTKIGEATVKIK
jgi:hypothetical protein